MSVEPLAQQSTPEPECCAQTPSPITAHPIRIIPFDLGRCLTASDVTHMREYTQQNFSPVILSQAQTSIIKNIALTFRQGDSLSFYIYENGICVAVVDEPCISFPDQYECFSVAYNEDRKNAHSAIFAWEHPASKQIWETISGLRSIIKENTKKKEKIRLSANDDFEHRGMSYVMTLSLFSLDSSIADVSDFKKYPAWLQNNIHALLDPSIVYMEDSSKFEIQPQANSENDLSRILAELEIPEEPIDYERHHHTCTYMSWAAVLVIGRIQSHDIEEYTALEVQLQCDWYYVYCLEKCLVADMHVSRSDMITYQRMGYEIDMLQNRLYEFDDSSVPTRIIEIQKGLVLTSGLEHNIQHLQRNIKYRLDREQLEMGIRQRKLAQSAEIFLFIIAFFEVAPIVAEFGSRLHPQAGLVMNIAIILLGIVLLLKKD